MLKKAGLILLATLPGCATNPTYYNLYINDETAESRQLVIDKGYCTQVAAGTVPMPEMRHYQAGVSSYQITGSAIAYDTQGNSSRTSYSGNITQAPNPGAAFSSGFANGYNMGLAIRAKRERDEVIKGCMFQLGWTDDQSQVVQLEVQPNWLQEHIVQAEMGNADAANTLGLAYLEGSGVPRDVDKAITWLEKASGLGRADASYSLSYVYSGLEDRGYENLPLARKFLERAWNGGYAGAGVILGDNYREGLMGYAQNISTAVEHYDHACALQEDMGCFRLGLMYGLGDQMPQDLKLAFQYLVAAHKLGNENAEDYIMSLGPYTLEQEKDSLDESSFIKRSLQIMQYMQEAGYEPSEKFLNTPAD